MSIIYMSAPNSRLVVLTYNLPIYRHVMHMPPLLALVCNNQPRVAFSQRHVSRYRLIPREGWGLYTYCSLRIHPKEPISFPIWDAPIFCRLKAELPWPYRLISSALPIFTWHNTYIFHPLFQLYSFHPG